MDNILPLFTMYDKNLKDLWLMHKDGSETIFDDGVIEIDYNNIEGFRAHGSPYFIKIPSRITDELAYLTGVLLGDGCLRTPIVRKKGGHYWKVDFTCQFRYSKIISDIIWYIFNYKPVLTRDKRKKDCWNVCIHSIVIFRFFNKVIGIPYGRKGGKTYWPQQFCNTKDTFRHFLAGFTDADGHISKKYLAIVQKDKSFLENLKKTSRELFGIEFNGPYVNRKIRGEIVGWCITLSKNKMKTFFKEIPLKYKGP